MECRCLEKIIRAVRGVGMMPRMLLVLGTFMSETTTGATELQTNKQCVLQFRIRKLPLLLVPIPAPWPSKLENEHWTTVLEKLQTAKMSQSSVFYEEQCKISMNEIVANQTYPLVKGLHTITKWVLSWECRVGLVCGSVLQKTILLE